MVLFKPRRLLLIMFLVLWVKLRVFGRKRRYTVELTRSIGSYELVGSLAAKNEISSVRARQGWLQDVSLWTVDERAISLPHWIAFGKPKLSGFGNLTTLNRLHSGQMMKMNTTQPRDRDRR
jgi:hypothetical protein